MFPVYNNFLLVDSNRKHKVMLPGAQADIDSFIDKFLKSIDWGFDKTKGGKGLDFIVEDVDVHLQRYSLDLIFTFFYRQTSSIDYYGDKDEWQH